MQLGSLYRHFRHQKNWYMGLSRERQERILHRLAARLGSEPDLVTRSWLQFLAQARTRGLLDNLCNEAGALLFGIPFVLVSLLRFRRRPAEAPKPVLGVIYGAIGYDLLPQRLFQRRDEIRRESPPRMLAWDDVRWLFGLCLQRRLFSAFFFFKNLYHVAQLRAIFARWSPEVVICALEYTFSSSLVTEYCHRFGARTNNVMHGEKLFFVRDAFFGFDEFSVWDQHYVELFRALHGHAQFQVELPAKFQMTAASQVPSGELPVLKYFLMDHTESQIASLCERLRGLERRYRVVFRPHPRYTRLAGERLAQLVSPFAIEPPTVSIAESFQGCDFVVSLYSTVLFESLVCGKVPVVDDVLFPTSADFLRDLDFIVLKKPHRLLSQIIE